jgi:tripeptidyl-peptidase-1
MLNRLILVALYVSNLWLVYGVQVKMESMKSRTTLSKLEQKPQSTHVHEVIFAVKQNNLDLLQEMLMERSDPLSPMYQEWLSFEKIGEITGTESSAIRIHEWLADHGLNASWTSSNHHYIKVNASISKWEQIFETEFHIWKNNESGVKASSKSLIRAEHYSLPDDITEYISAVFNTVQMPPVITNKYHTKSTSTDTTSQSKKMTAGANQQQAKFRDITGNKFTTLASIDTTVAQLNSLYNIPSNLGSALLNQSVFETAEEHFSADDLDIFQYYYGLTRQPAVSIGNRESSTGCAVGDIAGDSCFEGNLDIQYMMGVAQRTSSVYWYVDSSGSSDPFVAWITDVADERNPPRSNSISWGSTEQVSCSQFYYLWFTVSHPSSLLRP